MATRTRSHSGDSPSSFVNQNLISHPGKEVCSFNNADIAALRNSGAFPDKTIIRPFDRSIRSDVSSNEWICFLAYPFSRSLRYPFPEFIMDFFRTTGLFFALTMPMVWRVLLTLKQIKTFHVPDLCIEDLASGYHLRSHGNSRFLLFSTSNNPLILKASRNEDGWQRNFFFDKRDSIDDVNSLPMKWLTSANFKELAPPTEKSQERIKKIYQFPDNDRSFSSHLPSSSQYSSSEMSAPVKIPETFEFEELDSYPGPAQGLEWLVYLYEDSCGLVKMLEIKLKKAETDVADQATIAAAKSKYYEDKYKAMSQEHQATIKKTTQEAQAKYDAAQVQHELDMASYWESLQGSVIVSHLQARLKMTYEARAMGLECPSWIVEAWEPY
ncbi:hypothetical protein Hanom_Chr06g00558401 [Helianthus anomalus]